MDSEDFKVICNLYQISIKVLTVHDSSEQKPVVSEIFPDTEMKMHAWVPPGTISDAVLFHTYDMHFDLITKNSSWVDSKNSCIS